MSRIFVRRRTTSASKFSSKEDYHQFDLLNGDHQWQKNVPEGYILYPVRKLNSGKVAYFNFHLAKEMGLINKNHEHKMNKHLEKKLLDTFSIRIINEYDQKQNLKFHPAIVKKNPHMATRYLQLQHKDKTGRTSGDGRSIWNGEIRYNGITWDVSSRGTGVTRLSPGAVEAKKPLKSGSTQFGYGCGLADLDELIAAAINAEVFHRNGINTERVLLVIDAGDGNGIGVRAGQNLFRPAHLFVHLKKDDYTSLKKATDFIIDRQYENKKWSFNSKSHSSYTRMLQQVTKDFANFSAKLEREYIFAWLDWDGDNVLVDAGIIDYGSIRQFGLRHDAYKYDDVDRYSTNLTQQKNKAREIVQTFAQLTDFLITGYKKPLSKFKNHTSLREFDRLYDLQIQKYFLLQCGLSMSQANSLILSNRDIVQKAYNSYLSLERIKTRRRTSRVPDGINRPAIFNMRRALPNLPLTLCEHLFDKRKDPGHNRLNSFLQPLGKLSQRADLVKIFNMLLADSARGKDRKASPAILKKIEIFLNSYSKLLLASGLAHNMTSAKILHRKSRLMNRENRITGDALINMVEDIIASGKSNRRSIQSLIDALIHEQTLTDSISAKCSSQKPQLQAHSIAIFDSLMSLIDGFKESI